MALNDVIRIALHYHANEEAFVSTFHYREVTADTGPPNLAGINIAFSTQVAANMSAFLSDDLFLGCSIANEIIAAGAKRIPSTIYYVDDDGDLTGRALPGNTVARLNLHGENHSRANRGALILSGLRVVDEQDNGPTSGVGALINTNLVANLITDLAGLAPSDGDWEFGYMSRAAADPLDPPISWPGVFIKPSTYTLSRFFGTLRTRQGNYTAVRGSL